VNSGDRIRVLFVVPFLNEASGWLTACRGMIDSVANTGAVEAALAIGKEDERAARELFPDFPIRSLPSIYRADYSHPRTWITAVRSAFEARFRSTGGRRIDLVHSFEAYPAGWIGHLFARASRVPHVITAVGTYSVRWSRANPLDRSLYRRALAGASCVSSISHATLQRLRGGLGANLPSVPYRVNLLGIDSHENDALSDAVGKREAPVLLTVGAIKRRKGHDIALRAFFRVCERYPDAEYRVIGKIADLDFFDELQTLVTEKGSRGVKFLGSVSGEELQRHYCEASVFVLTSRDVGEKFEGFGLVCLEAGRFGVPVVATDSGGLSEAVRDGVTGLVVEAEDVDGVARGITRLLDSPELARSLGRANRSWARKLSWSRFAREQLEIYEDCLGAAVERL